jgi:SAM-dependent methyltransferase
MRHRDDAARVNELDWDRHAAARDHNSSRPKLDLDRDALRAYAQGGMPDLPEPYCDQFPEAVMMTGAAGLDVLCLASGGGHQSAEFGLIGAKVTVLDLSKGQLQLDEEMARHYGYPIRTVHGDMRDLSAFEPDSFDRVVQGVGICFVPDVREVYREVARVLRRGGLYSVQQANPFTYPADFDGPESGWDGVGYRIVEPYRGGPILRTGEGCDSMREGEFSGEFRHTFADMLNGLVEAGLGIQRVGGDIRGDIDAEAGSERHMQAIVPQYFCIIAKRA